MKAFWKSLALLMDGLVAPAFGAPGYWARRRTWSDADMAIDLRGRRYVVTGANAGIGRAASKMLAERGAQVEMLCRNLERGEAARDALREETGNPNLFLHQVDLSKMDSIRNFGSSFEGKVDGLIHNAGVLVSEKEFTEEGIELTFATHVVGPFLLTHLLKEHLLGSGDPRIVWVSSGGMYTQKLEIESLEKGQEPFDGVVAYAQAKRAQIAIGRELCDRSEFPGVSGAVMHPGWADTGGVKRSLPLFYKMTRFFLRDAAAGADTAVWLAVAPSRPAFGFYLDRVARREHLPFRNTRTSEADRASLWSLCEDLSGVNGTEK